MSEKNDYDYIRNLLKPIFESYQQHMPHDINWTNMYNQVEKQEKKYKPYRDPDARDVSFCLFLIGKVLLTIKRNPSLFHPVIDYSIKDYVLKFWGQVIEELFNSPQLTVTWLNAPSTSRYASSGHRKLQRVYFVHDMAVTDSGPTTSSISMKIFGLTIKFVSLQESGQQVTKEYHISENLVDLESHMDLAFDLLRFRAACLPN